MMKQVNGDPIELAKATVRNHEKATRSGNVDEIAANFCTDVVLLTSGAPLVQGMDAFKAFYEQLLSMGAWDFEHAYAGAEQEGELVILYGVARGTLSPPGAETAEFANNFLLTLKSDGEQYKIWKGAFAPTD